MHWLKLGFSGLLLLVGLVWILQGFNLIKGSGMSGHGEWVVGGAVVVTFGAWLLWSVAASRFQWNR